MNPNDPINTVEVEHMNKCFEHLLDDDYDVIPNDESFDISSSGYCAIDGLCYSDFK